VVQTSVCETVSVYSNKPNPKILTWLTLSDSVKDLYMDKNIQQCKEKKKNYKEALSFGSSTSPGPLSDWI
jgi:hypothetical protein